MRVRYQLARPDGVGIRAVQGSVLEASGVRGRVHFDVTNARIAEVLAGLDQQDVSEVELYALAAVLGGPPLQGRVHGCLALLKQVQAISYVVRLGEQIVARILPFGAWPFCDRQASDASDSWGLCTGAYFRVSKQGLHLLAPAAFAEVIVDPTLASPLMACICDPGAAGPPSDPAICLVRRVLADTRHLSTAGRASDDAAALWSFTDLLFHSASRLGHQWGPFGGHSGDSRATPIKQRPRVVARTDLRDALKMLPRTDPSFKTVLESRRSRCHPGAQPLSLAELAGVLSLAAEPKARNEQGAGRNYPYPSGGGIYKYHIYVAVHRCLHLEPGLYRHAAEDCTLQKLDASPRQAEQLAAQCGSALGLGNGRPDAVLIVTADIGEFSARYDAIAYRLVLLGAGCLIQNLGLAASALGVAGCAVGGGNPVLFAEIAGADPLREPSIAEFTLSGGAP
jgi:SagB-type dehydrogenase family enzyme